MPAPSVSARRAAFADFVRRSTAQADARGMSIPKIAARAGMNNTTIYRWRDGVGTALPNPEQVVAFCDAVGVSPAIAFAILWPGRDDKPVAAEPIPVDPDVERQMRALLRELASPTTKEARKTEIRVMIGHLAGEVVTEPGRRRTAS